MKRLRSFLLAVTLPVIALANEPPPLRNNPFSRPAIPVILEEVRPNTEPQNGPLLLIATMVSTRGAYANVDGRVMRPGEEIHGYLLKQVFEDRAVFERNGNELSVYVKPELESNDEQATPNPRRR